MVEGFHFINVGCCDAGGMESVIGFFIGGTVVGPVHFEMMCVGVLVRDGTGGISRYRWF